MQVLRNAEREATLRHAALYRFVLTLCPLAKVRVTGSYSFTTLSTVQQVGDSDFVPQHLDTGQGVFHTNTHTHIHSYNHLSLI